MPWYTVRNNIIFAKIMVIFDENETFLVKTS